MSKIFFYNTKGKETYDEKIYINALKSYDPKNNSFGVDFSSLNDDENIFKKNMFNLFFKDIIISILNKKKYDLLNFYIINSEKIMKTKFDFEKNNAFLEKVFKNIKNLIIEGPLKIFLELLFKKMKIFLEKKNKRKYYNGI